MKLSSAKVKICQMPHVNFETHNKSIPLWILYHSSVSWKITSLHFFSSDNIYFAQKEPIKVNIFETFKWSGQNLSNSSCLFSNDKLIPLQILYHSSMSWRITPLYFFSSNNIYFAQKEPIKGKNFETSKYLKSNYVKFLLSILKWQIDSSPNFVSPFSVMKDNSSVLF